MGRKGEDVEGDRVWQYAKHAVSFEMQDELMLSYSFGLAEWALATSTPSRIGEPTSVRDRKSMKKSD